MKKIYAYQIAEGIDIKNFKKNYIGKEYYSNVFESFYVNENDKYLYVLSYGVIVFSGYDEIKISEFLDFIKPWCKDILSEKTWDEFAVYDNSPEDKFGYNEIYLVKNNPDIMRIIMLNAGQSAALDYFSNLAQILMDQTNGHTRELEIKGKLNINNKKLLKFIGRTMNIKNGIVDNLYIIDSPDVTWEDEYLNKIDT